MNGQATCRICVINDSPDFLEMMHALLEMEGYTVRVEHEIAARLDKIEEWQPDLMVIDILKGRTPIGWELIHQIQQHPTLAAIPIIVCTAAAQEVRGKEAMLAQQNIAVLLKPFEINDLLALIEQLAGQREQNLDEDMCP